MEIGTLSKYAIIVKKTELKIHINADLIGETSLQKQILNSQGSSLPVEAGTLVKIFSTAQSKEDQLIIVQILNFVNHDIIYENLYECAQNNILRVSENLWPYVISISQPNRRLPVVSSKEVCIWLSYLKLNSLLSVKGEFFQKNNVRYDCIVRYIGPVQELHPVGYFFGLELLHLENGESPQSEDIPFSIKYMQCSPSLAIFTTADWITPIASEIKKKFSAKQILNETIEKVCNVIVPSGVASLYNSTPSTGTYKKDKKKNSQFYCTPISGNEDNELNMEKKLSNYEEINHSTESCDMPRASDLLQQHSTSANKDNIRLANIASINELNKTLSNEHADKEIIVIDNNDIQESTNKSHVLIVDKDENVDLADLLGENWPNVAGETAAILNRNLKTAESQPKSGSENEHKTSQLTTEPHAILKSRVASFNMNQNVSKTKNLNNMYDEGKISGAVNRQETCQFLPGTGLTVGSLVEISLSEDLYGVIRWIGVPPGEKNILVGVELEDVRNIKDVLLTDGCYNEFRLFQCHEGRGIFVSPDICSIDKRFIDIDGNSLTKQLSGADVKMFGHIDCPSISGAIPPLKFNNILELEEICGKFKGIQGHHNSCYLDATLFSMFTFTSAFDALLYRSPDSQDIPNYTEVQKVLREEIVNPLRKNVFVRADRVMKLRKLLDQLSSVSGLTSEEKDPEEFLNSLLAQILHAEPFLKLSSGQDSFFYQLFVEKDERLSFPTVQQLFEQSFHSSDIKLKEVPSCLIIQMPRFGKNYKMYPRILPSQILDVTDIIEDSPRQCSVCGKLAEYECMECFGSLHGGSGLECTAFCQKCLNTVHMHNKRFNHASRKLAVPKDFKVMAEHMCVPRLYMELFAVVCIETSHYVAFVKGGSGPDAPWCFFDSMADRKGETNGYNIPEMVSVPELPQWLSDEGARAINETSTNDKVLPEHAKRLFCDAYMCMYQSTEVMMYR